jgi:bis(5'-nucleosyl)-tetraphosphatase (symmetrical)
MLGENGRRIFIGDIQGCRAELESLLAAVAFDPAHDELHPVGDLVNRGPDSLGVLRLLREHDAGGVLGNHDLHLLRRAAGTRQASDRDTLDLLLGPQAAPDAAELLAWLATRPFLRVWDDLLLVHAALSPAWPDPAAAVAALGGLDPLLPHPDSDFATRARYCDATGQRPETDWPVPAAPFRPWFDWPFQSQATVVFGHWARMGLVTREATDICPALRGLDTGCVWGKELTAWIAEEDRLVQVRAERVYSATSLPPEAFS